mmetsp:Transcript_13039/g.40372  ORF Transcript_13039/g.40372 Transcript_13039/m.40372 type:complete len:298 (+) Transcript_13039:19-912(+)
MMHESNSICRHRGLRRKHAGRPPSQPALRASQHDLVGVEPCIGAFTISIAASPADDVALAQGARAAQGQPLVDASRVVPVEAGQHPHAVLLLEGVAADAADLRVLALPGAVEHRRGGALHDRLRGPAHRGLWVHGGEHRVQAAPGVAIADQPDCSRDDQHKLQEVDGTQHAPQLLSLYHSRGLEGCRHAEYFNGGQAQYGVDQDGRRVHHPPQDARHQQVDVRQARKAADTKLREAEVAMRSVISVGCGHAAEVEPVQAQEPAQGRHLDEEQRDLGGIRRGQRRQLCCHLFRRESRR